MTRRAALNQVECDYREMRVSEVAGAFHSMELREEERDTSTGSTDDDHRACETVALGRRDSPRSWGLGASGLGLFGLASCETTELRLELVVNAPSGDHDPSDGELCGPR
jgi:hypothetical protein